MDRKKENISIAVIKRLPKYHRYLLELVKNGALLKKYNADNHEDLKKLIEINNLLKDNNISYDKLKKILEAFKE